MCDLGLAIEGSGLEPRLQELEASWPSGGSIFRPHYWLSDEWFCPDGVPGIAIPFYLAHPRLARLEQAQMLEVEGGTVEWCLKILRHEAGHAIDNAYRLRERRRRRELFGLSSAPYPKYYLPRPYSKSFVMHLDAWYAQSHPDEDFAETFAVWLDPGGDWRSRYADWPARRKLEYVDHVMRGLAGSARWCGRSARWSRSSACARPCASTTSSGARSTASTTRTSTTATCGGCSPTIPSTRSTRPRPPS